MFGHEPLQATKLVPSEATGRNQGYRFEPELSNGTALFHMDVGQLGALVAVEEEPR